MGYSALGVELGYSEFTELMHVIRSGGEGHRYRPYAEGYATYESLSRRGLVEFEADADGEVVEAWATDGGRNWARAYEDSVAARTASNRHDWLVAIVGAAAGAVFGGIVALVVEAVTHNLIGA